MRVRAVRSFVWHGPRDVDVGEVLDVPEREAFVLITAYGYCVPEDGAPPTPPVAMTVADPVARRRR